MVHPSHHNAQATKTATIHFSDSRLARAWLVLASTSEDIKESAAYDREKARKLRDLGRVHPNMGVLVSGRGSHDRPRLDLAPISGQWRAMRDGNAGNHGSHGNVVSVSYRI
jgi:hypothetical protein